MKVCSVDGCCNAVYSRGICNKHWQRLRKHGDVNGKAAPRPTRICKVDGCEAKYFCKGYCTKHYSRWVNHGTPDGTAYNQDSPEERFWRKVDKTGDCWLWTGFRDKDGYGSFTENGRNIRTHRFSYELHKGQIPEGMLIMHSCDNPACVNPDHLTTGTQKENIADAVAKGRFTHPNIKAHLKSGAEHRLAISSEKALAVAEDTGSSTFLARKHGVSYSIVRAIKNGTHWSCR